MQIMDLSLTKKESFTLQVDLIERLKAAARKLGWSYNEYVESVLLDAVYNEPKAETISAIEEAKRGEYAGTIDTSSIEAMTKSILG